MDSLTFNPRKHKLGKLCKRNHEWKDSGKSLRYTKCNGCLLCKEAAKKGKKRRLPIEERFWLKVKKTETCWLWEGYKYPDGYGRLVGTSKNGIKHTKAHRFSYELHYGQIPDGLCVCHKCDVPSCVRPDHLWLGTHFENMFDKSAKDRNAKLKGQKNGRAKLTEKDVRDIRARYVRGSKTDGAYAIAKDYKVHKSMIAYIVQGKNWKHI